MHAIGTLTKKIDPHQNLDSKSPPAMGPMAIPRPIVPAQTPMARARSPGSRKMSLMIASDVGMVRAAPAPMTARNAMSVVTDPDKAAPIDPSANTVSPIRKNRLRPNRSASVPPTSKQAGEHHGVGVDDPLELARCGMQVPDERRECDVEDGVVDVDDQRRQTHDGQGQPPVPVPLTGRHRLPGSGQQAHRSSPAHDVPSRPGPKVISWPLDSPCCIGRRPLPRCSRSCREARAGASTVAGREGHPGTGLLRSVGVD